VYDQTVRKSAIHHTMVDAAATGVLHGNTITLDAPVPPFEGRRVRVIIAPEDRDPGMASDEQTRLWDEWVRQGPQGPIEDEGEPEFP
jgi:hypothetical protein